MKLGWLEHRMACPPRGMASSAIAPINSSNGEINTLALDAKEPLFTVPCWHLASDEHIMVVGGSLSLMGLRHYTK